MTEAWTTSASRKTFHVAYRRDIDGLRAIAILLVLGFHAFPALVPGGFVGVDVFFVISGYLIGSILLGSLANGSFSLTKFYARRVKRIFPALTLVLFVGYALGWHILLADEFKQLGADIAASAGFVANLVLWAQSGYFDRASDTKPFLHLWSLGIEEQFYIGWPLLLWTLRKNRRAGAIVLSGIALLSLLGCIILTSIDRTAAFYSPLSRCWELAGGTLLFYLFQQRHSAEISSSGLGRFSLSIGNQSLVANLCAWCGLILILVAGWALDRAALFPGAWALLPVLGSLLVISAGGNAFLNRRVLASRLFVGIGLISYSTYLWHWTLLAYLRISVGAEAPAMYRLGAVALSFVLAALTYRLIENPLRSGPATRTRIIGCCAALATAGALGLFTYFDGGIVSRYPKLIQQLTDVSFSITNESRENKCFLAPEQDATQFAPECLEAQRRPLVFLWGDSHAATMYPGLKTAQRDYHFGIAQFTSSACPPVIGVANPARPRCAATNDAVLKIVEQSKPDVVLLEAGWFTGPEASYGKGYDGNQLDQTVDGLKMAGIGNIVIVGTSPFWQDRLPRIVLNAWKNDPFHHIPPQRMKPLTWDEMSRYDATMRGVAKRLGVKFISIKDILCNDEGCITRTGDDDLDITSFDGSHLTPRAADYAMREIFRRNQLGLPESDRASAAPRPK